jgi:hypothetical protein
MKLIRFLLMLLLSAGTSLPSYAASLYTDLTISQLSIDVGNESLKPFVDSLRLGYQVSQEISLEAQLGKAGSDDKLGNGSLQVDNVTSLFVRIGGQSSYNDVKLYLLVGRTKAELIYSGTTVDVDKKYQTNLWGIGAEENSRSVKNMAYILEYVQHNDVKDVSISAITLGLRYNLF